MLGKLKCFFIMLKKHSDSREDKTDVALNSKNVNSNVSTDGVDQNGGESNEKKKTQLSLNIEKSYDKDVEVFTLPEGYLLLPEEFFPFKQIPPPLVCSGWFKLLNSDEECGEDSIPLAKLKVRIQKKKRSKLKLLDDEKKQANDYSRIDRKRGRPKKQSTEKAAPSVEVENDTFWNAEGDISIPEIPNQTVELSNDTEDESSVVEGDNEHDYYKSAEGKGETEKKEIKNKKRKNVVEGVKIGNSKLSFPCFECGKSFSAASTLKCHQRIHNGTLLECPECHKGFVTKYLLKCHMRIHNGDLFMCHKCGRGFTTAELLKVHSRVHTGDRPFVCNICGKSFPTSSNMLQHKQIHNSEKKFLCSQCGSSFVQRRCLDFHMLTHAEKKNICNVCGKLWARKSDLVEHMRVHTGVKPYCCTICPQKFSQASSLKRHQLVHVDAKPISCLTCNKMFKCQEYYKRHLRKHEKNDYLCNV